MACPERCRRRLWRHTTFVRDHIVEEVQALKAQPGGTIVTDGSSQLVPLLLRTTWWTSCHAALYPLTLGRGKRIWASDAHTGFRCDPPRPTQPGSSGSTTAAAVTAGHYNAGCP